MTEKEIYAAIAEERERQDRIHGAQELDDGTDRVGDRLNAAHKKHVIQVAAGCVK